MPIQIVAEEGISQAEIDKFWYALFTLFIVSHYVVFCYIKENLRPKLSPVFLAYAFVNFMEKESCTKFCGVFVRFHEIIKLQSFEFSVSDAIPANVQNISSLVFFAFFC